MPFWERVAALAMMGLCAAATLALLRRSPTRLDALMAGGLGAMALGWLLHSPAYEGPGIVPLTSTSGLTVADLGVPPSLFLSFAVLYAAWRDRRGRSAPQDVAPR